MKLSCECVRDILLCLEETDFLTETAEGYLMRSWITAEEITEKLSGYTEAEVVYTLLRLEEGGFITTATDDGDDALLLLLVTGMTYDGHELLERLRPETVWEKSLSLLKKLGSFSIDLLSSVSGSILTAEASRWIAGG